MFKRILLLLFLSIFLLLPACNIVPSFQAHEYLSIEDTIDFLTSDECGGRLVGTTGNSRTQSFIESSLKSFGIEKYSKDYKDSFEYTALSITDTTLETKDRKLQYNSDFFVSKISNCDLHYPVVGKEHISEPCIVLLDSSDSEENALINDKVKAIIKKTDAPIPFTPREKRISVKPVVYVTDEGYQYLRDNPTTEVHLKCSYQISVEKENNIVGIIRGNKAKKAIVLSAHFDHIGQIGGQVFRGAIDNASGTAALLHTAKLLSHSIKPGTLDTDIIFAFFNAEEIDKLGSRDFSQKVMAKYKSENVINFNLDCVSSIKNDTLNIDYNTENLASLVNQFVSQLNRKGLNDISIQQLTKTKDPNTGDSDHIWFDNHVYLHMDSDKIHRISDMPEQVNTNLVEHISSCIAAVLTNPSTSLKEGSGETLSLKKSKEEIITEEERNLKPFEYMYANINGEITYVGNRLLDGTFNDVKPYFNGKLEKIPIKALDVSKYNHFFFIFSYTEEIPYTSQALNTPYKRNYRFEDMTSIGINIIGSSLNTFGQNPDDFSISLTIQKIDFSHKWQDSAFNTLVSNFGNNTFEFEHHKLYFKTRDSVGGDIGFISNRSTDNLKYLSNITVSGIDQFDQEIIEKFFNEYDIFSTLEAMEEFMNQTGEISYN